ncbi:O-Antigen ligase [Proteiniborus ethanoligenes]|uniref:O-Antigen ligase n=1 Tax=Proteiniborus ethanoligenes TaxID=415015 RepID=A0A1H3LQ49_9FIRM|nr:O-antigen ligase family protein [Proteiniborus ethanoligenes]SDY66687.1 O-Antigen ligase [Proteiniborus ethanoligenes]
MAAKSASINRKSNSTIEYIVFWGICLLLFIGPYFRGLFFETEFLPAGIYTFSLALIWMISKYKDKDYKLIRSSIDILVLGLTLMYFVSIIYGVNTRLAILEALKYGNYFAIYIIGRDLISDEKHQKYLLNTIVISAIGIALVGIGSAIGTWEYNGAVIGGRISSTFQYPNTLASYLAAVFILTIGLIIMTENNKLKALYGASSSLMLFTFILTYSRGMWLILPALLLILFITIPNRRKLETIIYIITSAIISIPLAFLFNSKLSTMGSGLWGIVLGLVVASALLTYGISKIAKKLQEVSIKMLLIFIGILVVLFVALASVALTTTTSLTLNNDTTEDKWTSVVRNIKDIFPEEEYELIVKYTGTNPEDKPHIGIVRLYGVRLENNEEKLDRIEFVNLEENQGELNLSFTTLDNIEGLRVYFDNYYSSTSITYTEASIFDKTTGELIKEIPLKFKYIPENIYNRFQSISTKERSSQARLAFYKDGFKVIKEYPILGTGGGGWLTLYQMYQSYLYWTTQAHNYFLQMWIEVGIFGLGLFIASLLLLVYKLLRRYKDIESENNKILLSIIFTAVFGILVHAFMDFDLSLVSLTNILWVFIGVLASYTLPIENKDTITSKSKKKAFKPQFGYMNIVFSVFLLLVILGSSSLILSDSYKEKALAANERQDINEATKYFEKAAKLDPFMPEYRIDLGTFYRVMYQMTNDSDYISKAVASVEKGLELGQYNSNLHTICSSFFMNIGQVDRALELVEKSIELQPMRVENYVQKTDAYLTVFYHYIDQGYIERAKEIIEQGYAIKQQIKDINTIAQRPLKYNEDLLYNIGFIQFNYDNLNNQEYIIGDDYVLDFAYYFDLDTDNDGNIDELRLWNPEGGDVKYETIEDKEDNYIRITNNGESYGFIYSYEPKLDPKTEYKVIFKARGNLNENTFRVYVYDGKPEKKIQGILENIKLDENWNIYELNFKTEPDIESGTQQLRLQHNGKDDGYIDIKEVIVLKMTN